MAITAAFAKPVLRVASMVVLAAAGVRCGDPFLTEPVVGAGALNIAAATQVVGVSTHANFATNGEVELLFTAQDAAGIALFAAAPTTEAAAQTQAKAGWLVLTAKPDAAIVATADGYVLEQTTLSTQKPVSAPGKLVVAALIDESGSMADSDPLGRRGDAAKALLNVVCAAPANIFALFDFGSCGQSTGGSVACQAGMAATRDLMAVEAGAVSGKPPYLPCSAQNTTRAVAALAAQVKPIGDTPLFHSVVETCNQIAANRAAAGVLADTSLALVIMSDGVNFSPFPTTLQQAQNCLSQHSIRACTVGLGEGSELASNANPLAVADLKALAKAGNCTYAAAPDAQSLQNVFNNMGNAVKEGHNRVTFVLKPIPKSGTKVTGWLQVGQTGAAFSLVAP